MVKINESKKAEYTRKQGKREKKGMESKTETKQKQESISHVTVHEGGKER